MEFYEREQYMRKINTWPGWECVRELGAGSFGKVYEIQRKENEKIYKSALKVISIPQNDSELENAYNEGMDQVSVTKYFRSVVSDITNEVALMSDLKGYTNIVSYEDHMVIEHEDEIGWDILIRMELLTPLPKWIAQNTMTESEVIRLGCDICRALELCHQKKIIHRDIKPQNIFVNKTGDFKLGDFGIARIVEKSNSVLSQKGTYMYMAPEVYKGHRYNETADIYSLGIVLYRYLNQNRTPFLPIGEMEYLDRQEALERRMTGNIIPPPINGSEMLKQVVFMALQYDPSRRFQSAAAMRGALEKCSMHPSYSQVRHSAVVSQPNHTVRVQQPANIQTPPNRFPGQNIQNVQSVPKKKSRWYLWLIIPAVFILCGGILFAVFGLKDIKKETNEVNNCMDIEKYAWGTSYQRIFRDNITDDMVLGADYGETYYDDGNIEQLVLDSKILGYEMYTFYEFDFYGELISTSFVMSEDSSDKAYVEAFLELIDGYKQELGNYTDVSDYSQLRSAINDPETYAADITEKDMLCVSWGEDDVDDDKDILMWLTGENGYAEIVVMYTCPGYWLDDTAAEEESYGPSDAEVSMEVVLSYPYDDSIYGESWENFISVCDDRGYYYSIEWVESVQDVEEQVSIAKEAVETAEWTVMFLQTLDGYLFEDIISDAQEKGIYVVGLDNSYDSTNVNIVGDLKDVTYQQWESVFDNILEKETTNTMYLN